MSQQLEANVEWINGLDLLDVRIRPLPGATVKRPWPLDERYRLLLGSADADLVTLYEHVATVRHKQSNQMFVVARATIDTLMYEQTDAMKYPKWIMELQEKRAELKIFFFRATDLPSKFQVLGTSEEWWPKWLEDVGQDWVHDSLILYLLKNDVIQQGMTVEKRGQR